MITSTCFSGFKMQGKMKNNLSMFSRNSYFATYLLSFLTFSFYLYLQIIKKTNLERYLEKKKLPLKRLCSIFKKVPIKQIQGKHFIHVINAL